jgi:hypothetical protein
MKAKDLLACLAHALGVAGILGARWKPLISSPLMEMVGYLAGFSILNQALYTLFIITKMQRKPQYANNIMDVLKCLVILPVFILPIFIFIILFGAPVLGLIWETLVLSCHLALLSCLALVPILNLQLPRWEYLVSLQYSKLIASVGKSNILRALLVECWGGFIGTFIGAWLGAIPIPLDWDREWQVRVQF